MRCGVWCAAEREAERVAAAGCGRPRDGMKVARLVFAAAALAANAQGVCRALWMAAPRSESVSCVCMLAHAVVRV